MKKLKKIRVFDLQVWIAWTSFVFLAIISFIVEDNQILIIQSAFINAWIAVIFTAIVATGIGHAGFYYLLTKYDVSRITPLTLLAPSPCNRECINYYILQYFCRIR
jgi:EamA-like transporter family.